jgi:hypothetical protein
MQSGCSGVLGEGTLDGDLAVTGASGGGHRQILTDLSTECYSYGYRHISFVRAVAHLVRYDTEIIFYTA